MLLAVLGLLVVSCGAAGPDAAVGGRCGLWYAIGDTPAPGEVDAAAGRYGVVILNAWETGALRRLKERDPATRVLVYKDFSSTRDYEGAVQGGGDAERIPTGVGYVRTQTEHPEWFARDTTGARIEWNEYPGHWQMAVWDPAYQQRWATDVAAEVVREGWDGVFADNDFASLGFYSDAVLDGTADRDGTDRRIRDGLDAMVTAVGTELARADRVLVPNVSESRLYPGRWAAHSRFGGAMEENFAQRQGDRLLTWEGAQWGEMLTAAADGRLTLLVTAGGDRAAVTGAAGAALLAAPGTCWTAAPTPGYDRPEWTPAQQALRGAPRAAAREVSGAWVREFTDGWAAVNVGAAPAELTPPSGLETLDGDPVSGTVRLDPAAGLLLARRSG